MNPAVHQLAAYLVLIISAFADVTLLIGLLGLCIALRDKEAFKELVEKSGGEEMLKYKLERTMNELPKAIAFITAGYALTLLGPPSPARKAAGILLLAAALLATAFITLAPKNTRETMQRCKAPSPLTRGLDAWHGEPLGYTSGAGLG